MKSGLHSRDVLTLASWNIDWSGPDPAARRLAALDYLENTFGPDLKGTAIMFQEVTAASLQRIVDNQGACKHAMLSHSYASVD